MAKLPYSSPIALIGRGAAGWHAKGINWRSSGGNLENYTYWTGEKCEGYAAEAPNGCPVYDAAAVADEDAFHRFIIRGPICAPELPAGHWRQSLAPGSTEAPAEMPTAGVSLAYVAIDVYMRWMRANVPGVKFGTIQNGAAIWETEPEPQPKYFSADCGRNDFYISDGKMIEGPNERHAYQLAQRIANITNEGVRVMNPPHSAELVITNDPDAPGHELAIVDPDEPNEQQETR